MDDPYEKMGRSPTSRMSHKAIDSLREGYMGEAETAYAEETVDSSSAVQRELEHLTVVGKRLVEVVGAFEGRLNVVCKPGAHPEPSPEPPPPGVSPLAGAIYAEARRIEAVLEFLTGLTIRLDI